MTQFDFQFVNSLPPEQREEYIRAYVSDIFKTAFSAEEEINRISYIMSKVYEHLCALIYLIENNKEYNNEKIYDYIYNNLFIKSDSKNIQNLSTDDILKIGKEIVESNKKHKEDSDNE